MSLYKTSDIITLFFSREDSSQDLITGLTPTVFVNNAKDGTLLLAVTSLTETSPGYYSYDWTHGLTSTTDCVATYTEGGVQYRETFRVDADLSKLLNLDATVSSRESEASAATRYNNITSDLDSEGGEIA